MPTSFSGGSTVTLDIDLVLNEISWTISFTPEKQWVKKAIPIGYMTEKQ
jgi:hypothetical protein